jgi:hypothetical protein
MHHGLLITCLRSTRVFVYVRLYLEILSPKFGYLLFMRMHCTCVCASAHVHVCTLFRASLLGTFYISPQVAWAM